ncbi:hypothetical protein B0T26DRAFT_721299 [Lasiosphaeria miniovina]|uniref:Uncharacterized protein n=1 Tax=Lasiosphaeria miniovina TaxID=1954250 RepID=A0AA40DRJ7_9PEZI|nr:uncharacterized protein B0T26DRAFT_721299 [Lasiosphaeria miniovina]KAK0709368.1 hypothetical protein B0T26DRAFT_721299 [Lasiosphaeria miniovina]
MRHLDSGLRVFSSRKNNRRIANRRDDFILADMLDVLARLDLQASFFDGGRIPLLALVSSEERAMAIRGGEEEHAFSGLDDAHLDSTRLQNWMFHLLSENVEFSAKPGACNAILPPAILEEKKQLLKELGVWERRFERLVSDTSKPSAASAFLCGVQTLLIHHHTSQMLLLSRLPDDEAVFIAVPNPTARDVIRLARATVDLDKSHDQNNQSGSESSRRFFSAETGIVAPLAFLAANCADEAVSTQAVDLLLQCRRREGLYDARNMAAAVVQNTDVLRLRQQKRD